MISYKLYKCLDISYKDIRFYPKYNLRRDPKIAKTVCLYRDYPGTYTARSLSHCFVWRMPSSEKSVSLCQPALLSNLTMEKSDLKVAVPRKMVAKPPQNALRCGQRSCRPHQASLKEILSIAASSRVGRACSLRSALQNCRCSCSIRSMSSADTVFSKRCWWIWTNSWNRKGATCQSWCGNTGANSC